MKCVMVMFDSLNRHMLPAYGGDWAHVPNFRRLAQRTATFDRSYVCSMPCMPARRDLHTGRPNFLHRSWGPIEPFDDSMPQMLRDADIHTHLSTDHYHYWEDGGATYHNRYTTYDLFRGQEGDAWIGQVAEPSPPDNLNGDGKLRRQDWINRQVIQTEEQWPQFHTFRAGLDFIRRNHAQDRWFLQIECFDPHEPFYSPRKYKDRYAEHYDQYDGPLFDWPAYREVTETPEQVEHCRHEYASLLSMCDARLGDVLDAFDEHDLWKDTMLIVWTDHGFMLGEHNAWAKSWQPLYEEISHTPFFVWDPRTPQAAGTRRQALVQPAIDLAPTLLRFFGLQPTSDMLGHDLADTIAHDKPVRQAAIFGYHGNRVNVTDGRYVYLRAPRTTDNGPLYHYTLMPTVMRGFKPLDELRELTIAPPFPFTKNVPMTRFGHGGGESLHPDGDARDLLYDLKNDPKQQSPLNDPALRDRMIGLMVQLMQACHAPSEQYQRMGLPT